MSSSYEVQAGGRPNGRAMAEIRLRSKNKFPTLCVLYIDTRVFSYPIKSTWCFVQIIFE